jgi:hypothetical protein
MLKISRTFADKEPIGSNNFTVGQLMTNKMTTFKICALLGIALSIFGCNPSEDQSEQKGFIANNDSGNNYMLAFLGDSTDIPGTLQDIPAMSKVFNAANGLSFQMPGPYHGGWQYPNNSLILSEVGKAAKAMLDKDLVAWKNLQRGGTLFIYFTSHGMQDGSTSTGGGSSSIQFAEIARAIRTARGEYPLERLVVFYDTCFSGQNIVGSTSIGQKTGISLTSQIPEIAQPRSTDPDLESFVTSSLSDMNSVKGFYKSAIFIGASRPNETSGDNGNGGEGTQALIRAISAAKGGAALDPGARQPASGGSIQDLLNSLGGGSSGGSGGGNGNGMELTQSTNATGAGTGSGTATATIRSVLQTMVRNASGQVPVYCVEPKELADDFFFDPPAGYLPMNPMNALKTGSDNRECSR